MTLAPSQMLCFSLYSAAHAMQAAYTPLLAPLGLTYPQYLVLSALASGTEADQQGQSLGQIGAQLMLDSNTLTPMVKRMEAAGWVVRSRNRADERQVLVQLTQAGAALVAEVDDVPACFVAQTGLDPAAIDTMRTALTQLRDRLRQR